jgi:16S rRNA (cytosine967-C5)-methyltransferase
MTPAARLAAAGELVAAVTEGSAAADRQIDAWFRRRRFAGSGDRRAITALVYETLRRQGELRWRLGGEATPRLLAFAASGLAAGEIEAACSGGGYAPAPLSPAERAALSRLERAPAAQAPDWARGNFPAWLEPALRKRFGDGLAAQAAALNRRAAVDLRVNTLKADRDAVLRQFADTGITAAPTPYSPVGVRLAGRERLGSHPLLAQGLVEPQDEAAQVAGLLVGAQPGGLVVDYCAGAGGKSLGMAAAMKNRGRIVALDRDAGRLAKLAPRARRAKANIVQTHVVADADPWLARYAGKADRVLVDAPCSGSGTWRRNPEAAWRLTPEILARHLAQQAKLLDGAAALLKPGGRLAYATCSLLPDEDEGQVEAFLARHGDFAPLDVRAVWTETIGGACPFAGPYAVFTPLDHGTDGFFVAVLERRA